MQSLENYSEYRLSPKEMLIYGGGIFLILAAGSIVFYDTVIPAIVLTVPAWLLLRKRFRAGKAEKRKIAFKKQFLNGVVLLGDYLKSGYSVENAIGRSVEELEALWGKNSDVVREWRKMGVGLKMAVQPEELFRDLGTRTGIDEVRTFSELCGSVERSGGQLSDVVRSTANQLSEQFAVEEQIRTATASRRFEQRIMNAMPLAILLYVRFGSPDLLTPLYTTMFGRIMMTVAVGMYIGAMILARRILDIRM